MPILLRIKILGKNFETRTGTTDVNADRKPWHSQGTSGIRRRVNRVGGYLFHAIRHEQREEVEIHLSSCPECHQMMEGLRIGVETFFEDDAAAKVGII